MIVELANAAPGVLGCDWWDAICVNTHALDTVTKAVQNKAITDVAAVFMNAWQQLEMFFFASWIAIPLLIDINNPDGTTIWLQDTLSNITVMFAILGALVSAGWTFIKLGPEKIRNLGFRLSVLLLISTCGGLIVVALDSLARAAAIGLLTAVGINEKSSLASSLTEATIQTISPAIPFIIGLVGTLGVIVQWGVMIARGPLVTVLVGVWPMAAAAATLGVKKGEDSFDKITSWLLAFVLYPFPAAIVYAAAFRLKSGTDGVGGIMYGLVLEILALFLLPAILRIIAPQVQALGKAYGGEIALKAAAQAAEVAVAVGASVVTAGAVGAAMGAKMAAQTGAQTGAQVASAGGNAAAQTAGAGAASPGGSPAPSGSTPSAPAGPGGGEGAGAGAPGAGRGANTVDAGKNQTAPGAASAAPDRREPAPVPAAQGSGGAASEPAPAQPATRRSQSARSQRLQSAAQTAGQAASNAVGRAARDGIDDIDELIGGKHD